MNKVSIFKRKQEIQNRKKGKAMPELEEPRAFEDINREYNDVCVRYGDHSLKKHDLEFSLQQLQRRQLELRTELASRQKIDAQIKAAQDKLEAEKKKEGVVEHADSA